MCVGRRGSLVGRHARMFGWGPPPPLGRRRAPCTLVRCADSCAALLCPAGGRVRPRPHLPRQAAGSSPSTTHLTRPSCARRGRGRPAAALRRRGCPWPLRSEWLGCLGRPTTTMGRWKSSRRAAGAAGAATSRSWRARARGRVGAQRQVAAARRARASRAGRTRGLRPRCRGGGQAQWFLPKAAWPAAHRGPACRQLPEQAGRRQALLMWLRQAPAPPRPPLPLPCPHDRAARPAGGRSRAVGRAARGARRGERRPAAPLPAGERGGPCGGGPRGVRGGAAAKPGGGAPPAALRATGTLTGAAAGREGCGG